jgi:hypothetical protein
VTVGDLTLRSRALLGKDGMTGADGRARRQQGLRPSGRRRAGGLDPDLGCGQWCRHVQLRDEVRSWHAQRFARAQSASPFFSYSRAARRIDAHMKKVKDR